MSKRMLIDATHAEETRVVVMDGNRLEDYDVEAASKKQLKGNIYLARVVRVEPSLQAAFVEYGGNRHGFLAFSEIHPDYYQIPVADREKLLALQAEEEALIDAGEASTEEEDEDAPSPASDELEDATGDEDGNRPARRNDAPDYVGGETDTGEEALIQKRIARFLRNYRIQEVIRRRQVLLVQVVKEERGNKGAALTTYISLAGRYCVLMPNALRGGGVSRKITSVPDRRRLRDIISALDLPRGMAMIVRTAGAQRPGPEITRDCEYLLHLWDDIRDLTMRSVAPALIYEEASLVKRAIRDVYTREVSEILVDGEQGWKAARDFMRLLMPQHAEKVRLWNKENQPLFAHYHVEGHLDAMLSPVVSLRSGGYLVINQTEALVAIDVNSGKATSQRNIEETAFRTNQEAADEVARQLRLRDLAGLIVIDFIDMESRRHNSMIERRLKDALRHDRARIQMGSISHFGLLEMSRQRLRPSVAEAAFTPCPHCQGTGMVRGIESSALHVLRAVEEEGARRRASAITVHVAAEIAFYVLNNKRDWLAEIEQRHQMEILFAADATLPVPEIRIERRQPPKIGRNPALLPPVESGVEEAVIESAPKEVVAQQESPRADTPAPVAEAGSGEEEPRRRRRRRRRRGGNGNREDNSAAPEQGASAQAPQGHNRNQTQAQGQAQSEPQSQADDEQVDAAPADTQTNLVPGRRRTRHSRVRSGRTDAPEVRVDIEEGPAPQPRRTTWQGPTPANPFGGSLDIFDLIENSTMEAAEAEAEKAARASARPARTWGTPAGTQATGTPAAPVKAPEPVAATPDVQDDAVSATDAKPARKRPARRRKAATAGDASPATAQAEAPETVTDTAPAAQTQAAEAEAQKPRRRAARKSADVVTEDGAEGESPRARRQTPARRKAAAPAEEATAPQADGTGTDAEKPAPRRRRAAAKSTATPSRSAAVETEAAEASQPASRKDDAPDASIVQPIVIEDDKPVSNRRTGWWRR
ncbi:Rne/Rng family ribonuclease [Acetobacter farinalis]|uniref:Ribonuclease E n=1 Tax=Acetobacter farinalis TaxID=1260984 RepID=A0ABT3Q738_9PROT|nr:ribonuclease E/G [Acetobacter farinalis]MCX2561095.1 Rne/Rng family ribonuclease [Acetobacter farinalis]NHO29656.1 Rne/Rng family ribonuclease [Acetobacter farinalis]